MKAVYSKIIKAGERTYFVDTREARNKSRYVAISCTSPDATRPGERRFKRDKVVFFAEEAAEVSLAIREAVELVGGPSAYSDKGARALVVLQRLRDALPNMDDKDEPQPGTEAVDALAQVWAAVKRLTKKGGS